LFYDYEEKKNERSAGRSRLHSALTEQKDTGQQVIIS
jgi:hypothetical protein